MSAERSAGSSSHRVTTFASAFATRARQSGGGLPHDRMGTVADVAAFGDVILLATPWEATPDALRPRVRSQGKTVIDCTNPLLPDLVGTRRWAPRPPPARRSRSSFPTAKVVKCFNTLGYTNFADPEFNGVKASMFYLRRRCGREAHRLGARQSARLRHDRCGPAIAVAVARGDGDALDHHGLQIRRQPALGVQAAAIAACVARERSLRACTGRAPQACRCVRETRSLRAHADLRAEGVAPCAMSRSTPC